MAPKKLPVATDIEKILATNDLAQDTVEVPKLGVSFVVRELSRGEWRKATSMDQADESEAYTLLTAVVEPKLTEDQAKRLVTEKAYSAAEPVLEKILELSGMVPGFR